MSISLDPESPASEQRPPEGHSAGVTALLRRWIVEGRYRPGERLAEIPVAEALGVSRTPVRLAFRTLEREGLLEQVGKRGLVVRQISEADVACAIEVRGVLEGLAARRLTESGAPAEVLRTLWECVEAGARIVGKPRLETPDVGAWSALNARFHAAIVGASGSRVIGDAIHRNDHLPFASADSIAIDAAAPEREMRRLQMAQMQHQLVLDAIASGEGARAEMLMREHAYVGFRYGALFDPPPAPPATATR
jgi:GntR family transcriptional regulator of vanillate catabolism